MQQPQNDLFGAYELDDAYDEMFLSPEKTRLPYQQLYQRLLKLPLEEMQRRQ